MCGSIVLAEEKEVNKMSDWENGSERFIIKIIDQQTEKYISTSVAELSQLFDKSIGNQTHINVFIGRAKKEFSND